MIDMIVIDTDVLIDAGHNVADAKNCIQEIADRSFPSISTVTQMELIVGCQNKKELRLMDQFLDSFIILRLDEQASDVAVELLRRYRLSHGLLIPDALIAATAIANDLPLVSKNQRDYRFIEDLQLLPYPEPFST